MTMTGTPTTGRWRVEPARSTVAFDVKHLGFATATGRFEELDGVLELAEGTASGSVAVASVDTGDEGRDAFLTSSDFFDAETFPRISYRASEVHTGAGGELEVRGEMTMHGVTRPLTLRGALAWDADRAALELSGELDRTEFGLRFPQAAGASDKLVSDTVRLRLSLSATRSG